MSWKHSAQKLSVNDMGADSLDFSVYSFRIIRLYIYVYICKLYFLELFTENTEQNVQRIPMFPVSPHMHNTFVSIAYIFACSCNILTPNRAHI